MSSKPKDKNDSNSLTKYRSFNREPLPRDPGTIRSLKIEADIREHVSNEVKKMIEEEKQNLPAFLRIDEELWKTRMAIGISASSLHFIKFGDAATKFNLTPIELENARTDFEFALLRERDFYFYSLAKRLQEKVRKETKESQEILRLCLQEIPNEYVDLFLDEVLPMIAYTNFDRHCWQDLPLGEKHHLKSYLQKQFEEQEKLLLPRLASLPKTWQLAFIDFINTSPKKLQKVFEEGMILAFLKSLLHKYTPKKPGPSKRDKEEQRRERASKIWPEILKKTEAEGKDREWALHELLSEIKEPGYKVSKKSYRTKENLKKRKAMDSYLRRKGL